MGGVHPLWQQAAGLLESACCVAAVEGEASDQAILLDERMGLRMVDASGWQLHALRHEYGAAAAYRIQRNSSGAVIVQAENDSDQCTLTTTKASSSAASRTFLRAMSSVPPHHLVTAPATLPVAAP